MLTPNETRLHSVIRNAVKENRSFDAHCALIELNDCVKSDKSRVRAWIEGPENYVERLKQFYAKHGE